MGTKANPAADDCYTKAADDEPLFTLLARDPLAAFLVMLWAELRQLTRGSSPKVDEARECAAQMRSWRSEQPVYAVQLLAANAEDVCDWVTRHSKAEVPVTYDDSGQVFVSPWDEDQADIVRVGDYLVYRDGRFVVATGFFVEDGHYWCRVDHDWVEVTT